MEKPTSAETHKAHTDHRFHYLMLGTALLAGGIILSPYVLPALGFGTQERAFEIMDTLQHATVSEGLAGTINSGLGALPLIGGTLAAGGIWPAAIAGALGIGGVMLGRYLEKKHAGKPGINWGKLIKYAALSTSLLIALPSILSSITIGITYMSYAFGDLGLAEAAGTFLSKTIGVAGTESHTVTGLTGALAALPHFLTCGLPLVPAVMSLMDDDEKSAGLANQVYTDGSISTALVLDAPIVAGKLTSAKIKLSHQDGSPVTPDDLAVVHTKKLHLFVVDSSLNDYHHLHPESTGTPGEYAFTFTPRTANKYSAWADITMIADSKNHKLLAAFPSPGRKIPPAVKNNSEARTDGLQFEWRCNDALVAGKPVIVEATVRDADGTVVKDLEPVMGAFAHLVGFGADGKSIVHTHPLGHEPLLDSERGEGRLRFHVEPNFSGPVQFYLQVKRKGQDVFAPFGQLIAPQESARDRISPVGHSGYAFGY